jgi:hypothetical protein
VIFDLVVLRARECVPCRFREKLSDRSRSAIRRSEIRFATGNCKQLNHFEPPRGKPQFGYLTCEERHHRRSLTERVGSNAYAISIADDAGSA